MNCQAPEFDISAYGPNPHPLPPCDGLGEVDLDGFLLCVGCIEALEVLTMLGGKAAIALGDYTLREGFGAEGEA